MAELTISSADIESAIGDYVASFAPKSGREEIGTVVDAFPTFSAFSNLQLLGILVGFAMLLGVISNSIFRACETRAREQGLIDRVTNY